MDLYKTKETQMGFTQGLEWFILIVVHPKQKGFGNGNPYFGRLLDERCSPREEHKMVSGFQNPWRKPMVVLRCLD